MGRPVPTGEQKRRARAAQSARAPPCTPPYLPRYQPRPDRSASVSSRKTQCFRFPNMVCRFLDTTAPTKEGLLWDDKIVSNLHEQMCGGYLQARDRALGIIGT